MKKTKWLLYILLVLSLCLSACGSDEKIESETKKKVVRFEDYGNQQEEQSSEEAKDEESVEKLSTENHVEEIGTTEEKEKQNLETEVFASDESTVSSVNETEVEPSKENIDNNNREISNDDKADTEAVIPGFNDSDEIESDPQESTQNKNNQENSDSVKKQEEQQKTEESEKIEQLLKESPEEGFWTDAF